MPTRQSFPKTSAGRGQDDHRRVFDAWVDVIDIVQLDFLFEQAVLVGGVPRKLKGKTDAGTLEIIKSVVEPGLYRLAGEVAGLCSIIAEADADQMDFSDRGKTVGKASGDDDGVVLGNGASISISHGQNDHPFRHVHELIVIGVFMERRFCIGGHGGGGKAKSRPYYDGLNSEGPGRCHRPKSHILLLHTTDASCQCG
ncbi:MAG: hypothetical protein AAB429_01140 [Patescibacteria group bacterium]